MTALVRILVLLAGAFASACAGAATPRQAHLDLDVTIDPGSRRLHAIAEITAPGEFRFALHDTLTVSSASVAGHPAAVLPAHRAGNMREWRLAAPPGARLRIEYGGTLPELDRALDHRTVLGAIAPMVAKEGTFLHSESGWYPRPAQFFSYRVKLSLPGTQRGLVAGRLVAESIPRHGRGNYVATFVFEQPAEGVDLMAGPYVVREKLVRRAGAAPLRLRTYFYRDIDALAESYLEDSRHYLELYSAQIAPYPYDGFSVVAAPLPTGFGMPTLTYLGEEVLRLPFIRTTSLGHEILHNWWGNGVYVDAAEGNWSEGLTTFMADYFYKERESTAAAREMRLSWLRDFAAVPAGSRQPLSAFRSRTHGAEAAVGYGKAAMVFFMLRDDIGEDAFRRGIRLFWERRRFRLSSWDDLRAAFEEAAGRPLATFFEQWIQRSDAPAIRIAEAKARTKDGAVQLLLTLMQTSPPYVLHVPVEIVTGGRSQTRLVAIDREREIATLDCDGMPDGVRLDPELRVWRLLDRKELPPILREWIVARAPRLAIVTTDSQTALAARSLSRRLFEMPAQEIDPTEVDRGSEPALIIGLHRDVDAALSKLGVPPRPAILADRGSAQVWTVRNDSGGAPLAVISARDAESLTALLRPLPHYGAQSYLVFDDSRAIDRGVWAVTNRLVPVSQDNESR